MLFQRVAIAASILLLNYSSRISAAENKTRTWKEHVEAARGSVKINDFEQAEANYSLAFREAEETFRGTDLRYLQTGYETAHLYIQLRKYPAAIAVINHVLARVEKPKAEERYIIAEFLNRLGDAYLFLNKLPDSEQAYNRAYELFRGRIDERTPVVAESLKGLAAVAVSRKETDNALKLYQQALDIAKTPERRYVRNYDPRPAASLLSAIENDIGILHQTTTNYPEAHKWFQSAQTTIEKNFGKTAAELEPILKNIARTYRLEKNYPEAEDTLIRSLLIDTKMKGGALSFRESSSLLGSVLFEQDDSAMDSLFARLLSGDSKSPPPEAFLPCATQMAKHFAEKDWHRATTLIDKAIAAAEKQFGPNNKELPQFLEDTAELSTRYKSPNDTERYLVKLIDCVKQNDPSSGAALAEPYKLLAEHYAREKSLDKAAECYQLQIAALQKSFGEKDTRVANAIDDEAVFLEKTDRVEQAKELRAKANKVRADALLNSR